MATEEIILNEEEWDEFQPEHSVSPDVSGKLWSSIARNTHSRSGHYSYFKWMAAASAILVVGVSWLFISKKQLASTREGAPVAKTRNISNSTPKAKTLTLSDGSTVELLPNSMLSYSENFNAEKRDIILFNGEATFNIAKDVTRPFSVYSHSVLVTVLGTRFTIQSDSGNNATKIILHEGRVMVKVSKPTSQNIKNEYLLTPGDIFILKKVAASSHLPDNKDVALPEPTLIDSLPARVLHLEKDKDDCYVFNNFPLDVVFDQLQVIYNTKIIYNKADLGNRSFIGKIDKKDSLYHILKSIALLNNFSLHQEGDSFKLY